jgi:hypothetical protein
MFENQCIEKLKVKNNIKVSKLRSNLELCRSMGEYGKKFYFENFGYQRLIRDMANLYYELLNAKK